MYFVSISASISVYDYFLVIVLFFLLWKFWRKRPKFAPPGTNGFPLIGVLYSIWNNIEQVMQNWGEIYGPIFMVKFGFTDVVILSDLKLANEVLAKNTEVADRPNCGLAAFDNNHGILFKTYDEFYQNQRRFGLKTLRGLGMGKRSLEPRVIEQAHRLCDKIERLSMDSKTIDSKTTLEPILYGNVSSVISEIIFGHDIMEKNEKLRLMIDQMMEPNKKNYLAGFLIICPYMKYLPIFSSVAKSSHEFGVKMQAIFKHVIDQEMKGFQPENPRGFADLFMNRILNESTHRKDNKTSDLSFTKQQMVSVVKELYLAGTDTTSTTLSWVLFYLASHQDKQDKLRNELNSVIGEEGVPSIAKKDDFPYTMAVLQEVLRLRPAVPLSVPHQAINNTWAGGYLIPKGSVVFTNLWAIHHSEDKWKNSDSFRPERHLNEKGRFVKSSCIIPFSVGRRSCLGQQLAVMELFLITVCVFRKFIFSLPTDFQPNFRGESMVTLRPLTYKVLIEKHSL